MSGDTNSIVDELRTAFKNSSVGGLPTNVAPTERVVSVLAGGLIGAYGFKRGALCRLALTVLGGALIYRGFTGHCHLYESLGISTDPDQQPETGVAAQSGVRFERTIRVPAPAQEVYDYWRNFERLPGIMGHLHSVSEFDERRSHWIARGPFGIRAEWDAEIINDQPGRLIAWQSLPDSEVDTAGSVHFEDLSGDRGSELTLTLKYDPPGGKVVDGLAWLLKGGVEREIEEDLRKFAETLKGHSSLAHD